MRNNIGLSIVDSTYEIFQETNSYKNNPVQLSIFQNLLQQFNYSVMEEKLEAGSNFDYTTMAIRLMDRLHSRGSLDGTDLLVLAHYLPNIHPLRISTSFLHYKYGLSGTAFALSDREDAIAFVALKVIRQYLLSRQYKRAVLLVMDQNTLPYETPDLTNIEPENCGVALVLEMSPSINNFQFPENSIELICEEGLKSRLDDCLEEIILQHRLSTDSLVVICNRRWHSQWRNRNGFDYRTIITDNAYLSSSPLITYLSGKYLDDNIIFFHLGTDRKLYKAVIAARKEK